MPTHRTARRELIFQLVETSRLLRTHVDHRAREHGTTRAQWGVLARLRRQEGLMQVDLADLLDMQPISLTRLIDRLEAQGQIERRADPRDRRVSRLHLTDAGRALVDSLDTARDAIAAEVLAPIDDDLVEEATAALEAIRKRLKELAAANAASSAAGQRSARTAL